ncbi:MAG: hypothetical protein Q8P95_04195 [bacterium]|nr:hypothetical protein [bacterium]
MVDEALLKKLKDTLRIGWFGFSADPPTLAHRQIIDAILNSGQVDAVVAFPAGRLAYKDFQSSDEQRKRMARLWHEQAGWNDKVLLGWFDLEERQAIRWYELWQELVAKLPGKKNLLVVGGDQYEKISKEWFRGKELIDQASILVVPRALCPDESTLPKHHRVIDHAEITGSSTDVRSGQLTGLDQAVRSFILREHLYGN